MTHVTALGRVLVPVSDQDQAIAFYTQKLGFYARADKTELAGKGVDVDSEMMGGEGGVPLMFFFRDQDKNTLMLVEE